MKTIEQRFWEKVDIRGEDDCWEWQAKTDSDGYGEFWNNLRNGKHTRSHQVSWILNNGDIPEGNGVLHSCDNPSCVNPKHLFLGTNQDNVDDRQRKGRWNSRFLFGTEHPQHGENSKHHKLTEDDVRMIRKLYLDGETLRGIAKRFGIAHGVVNGIIQGRKWAWLK